MARWRIRAGDILFCLLVFASVFGIQIGATFLHCNDVKADLFGTCCLCYLPENCDTNQTCPEGYQPSNISADRCKPGTETSTAMTFTTTEDAMETTITDNDGDNAAFNSSNAENEYVLCYKCQTTEFFNGTRCVPCHRLCLSCNGEGEEKCDPCRFQHQNRCVEQCPNGTDEIPAAVKGGFVCQNNTDNVNGTEGEPNDSDSFPVAIVAGSVGGGVVLISVVVIIIIAVRRRRTSGRTNGRSRMSEIIEDRGKVEEKKEETRKSTKTRHPDYENQPKTIATLPRDIENQSDNVLRYTKDPTASIQEGKTQKQDSSRDSGLYQNAAMIRVHTNFKDKRLSQEELNNQLEKEEVENLPTAPPLPTAKKKSGIMNRFSKRFSKNKTGSQIELVVEDQEYIDMDGARTSNGEVTESVMEPDLVEQEEYEDVEVGSQSQVAEHEEEDYENLQQTYKQSKMTKDEGRDIKRDKKSYENENVIHRLKKVDKPRGGDASVKQGFHGHGANNVDSEQERGQGQGSSTEEETPADLAGAEQEDYENTATFKKNVVEIEPGRVESPYENVQFRRK